MNPIIAGDARLSRVPWLCLCVLGLTLLGATTEALAHAVAEGDKGYIQEISGIQLLPFVYLGAKHMVTGYDHILFLFGVIFFLYRLQHIAIYVSLFALGHSTTMLAGVYFGIGINSYIIDAIIGFSIVYKALDNLGAKHMVTGYDHILFLLGVIFFLYKLKHIAIYVSLFAIGHSTTMLLGVYFNIGINSYIIDAIIGFSVVYKALDNLGAFQRWFGVQPDSKAATLIFGFLHGFGLSTKIIEYDISPDGLVPNLLAFNVGVEIGQLLALAAILIIMSHWRRTDSFFRHAYTANVVMMTAGFVLIGYQITGWFVA